MKNIISILLVLCSFSWASAQEVEGEAGKIWYSNEFLFINIVKKGVLVIDNKNPKQPQKLGFIQIPGNVDIAVKDEVLFANHHDDLIALDIKKMDKINDKKVLKRFDGVFPQYRKRKSKADIQWVAPSPTKGWMASSSGIASSSKGGSMTCFSLVDNYLYTLTPSSIEAFDLEKSDNPKRASKTDIFGDTYETIFSNGENLFVGGQGGMYIFDLNDPENPSPVGNYQHLESCDPVVVEGNLAYITLRTGNICEREEVINRLEIVDISNPANPRRISSNGLSNPHGLAVDKQTVFVCDGNAGLRVIDAHNPNNVRILKTYDDISTTYDVINIPAQKLLILVGGKSVIQYDYSDVNNLKKLSLLKTVL